MRIIGSIPHHRSLLIVCYIVCAYVGRVGAQLCTADDDQQTCDQHERCPTWAAEGECVRNRAYMTTYCPASCYEIQKDLQKLKSSDCLDKHEHCSKWAAMGECEENALDMRKYCSKSCGACPDEEEMAVPCVNNNKNCDFWAEHGECQSNPNYMEANCAKACKKCPSSSRQRKAAKSNTANSFANVQKRSSTMGTVQNIEGATAQEVADLIEKSLEYMDSPDYLDLPMDIQSSCQNRHELCTFWAHIGECDNNQAYMQTNCAPACRTCHMIDMENRCPKLVDAEPALGPGDLNRMFERILRNAPGNRTSTIGNDDAAAMTDDDNPTTTPNYTVHVHSRPEPGAKEISAALDKSMPPWVVTFEHFLTDEECDELVQLGYKYEYKRSEDVGAQKFDGSHDSVKSDKRTSENAWCSTRQGCREEEIAKRVHDRMSSVMGIPAVNSEDLQLLKYEKGQYYRTHHDYIPHQRDRQCGPRILTFFLYLSNVDSGGGTNFPQLDLTVEPKKGRALLWPSVLNSDPLAKDKRMMHQAMAVQEGVKYAANGWIHMYNYVDPQERGCN